MESLLSRTNFYFLNLDRDTERCQRMLSMGEKCGIPLQRVPAVYGAELSEEELNLHYDAAGRHREYAKPLSRGEHGCILSHLRAMDTFLASEADYAVILEDDAVLDEQFLPNLTYLLEHTSGWQCIKLYTEPCKLYEVTMNPPGAPVHLVFPKKIPWGAIGWLYTREAVETIRPAFEGYRMGFDVQLAQILFSQGIAACGVKPNMVTTWDPKNEASSIDAIGSRIEAYHCKPTRLQYLRHRLGVWGRAWGKIAMRRRLKKALKFT